MKKGKTPLTKVIDVPETSKLATSVEKERDKQERDEVTKRVLAYEEMQEESEFQETVAQISKNVVVKVVASSPKPRGGGGGNYRGRRY